MTNNPRIYLWIALALMLFLNYDAWQRDYGTRPEPVTNASQTQSKTSPSSASGDLANKVPEAPKPPSSANAPTPTTTGAPVPAPSGAVPATPTAETAPAPVIHVRTDVLDMDISTRGGTIQRVDLLK